jgi:hypothetical protein
VSFGNGAITPLGVALFCLLATLGSPDKLLLAADSALKVPFTDMSLPFLGFIVVASFLLMALFIYLHILYHYWLECERERQYINQRLIPPIESIPTLFSFSDRVSRFLTWAIFYLLVPSVLSVITAKARALPEMGLLLTYVTGLCYFVFFLLMIRRTHGPPHPPRPLVTLMHYGFLAVWVVGFIVIPTLKPEWFQRPLQLFRADLAQEWLPRTNMRNADARLTKFKGANLVFADLRGAALQRADFQGADLRGTDFQGADLWRVDFQGATSGGSPAMKRSLWEQKISPKSR